MALGVIYKDFATVALAEGDKKTLTMIVDPAAEGNVLIGAGVFADEDIWLGFQEKFIEEPYMVIYPYLLIIM